MSPTTKRTASKSANSAGRADTSASGFTAEERAAMKARAQELKNEARASRDRDAGEKDLLAKIAEMPEPERGMAKRLHEIVKANAPALMPRTWYGMPAYAKDGKVLCFFQSAHKFNTRYATLGFSDQAKLDDGRMWPTAFALTGLTSVEAAKIADLLKKATA